MAALDRAFPLAHGPHGAVLISHHLHLNVTAPRKIALTEHGRIAEGGLRFAPCGAHLFGEFGHGVHHPHTATAAACRSLDQYWQQVLRDVCGVEFRQHRDPGCGHHLLGLDLRTHGLHGCGRRSNPSQPGIVDGTGKVSVLREESVAGVDGVSACHPRRCDEFRAVEITVDEDARVGFRDMRGAGVVDGVDGDSADTETAAGRENPAGYFATVGDQDSCDHATCSLLFAQALIGVVCSSRKRSSGASALRASAHRYIRKTPNFDAPSIGPLAMADRHIPSTVRVSRGSITPSS